MAVHVLDPVQDPRWTELLGRHPAASAFHAPGWLEALRRTYGYEPVALTTSPPGGALENGLAYCRVRSWLTGRRMVSLPFSDHCQPLVDTPDQLAELAAAWRRDADRSRCRYVELRPLSLGAASELGLGETASYAFHMVDLRADLETTFRRFHKDSIQRRIRHAEREGLGYEVGRTAALVDKFYGLLLLTRQRFGLPPQPRSWFQNLAGLLGDGLQIHVASKDGQPVAAILTVRHGRTLVYKYGCSDTRFNNLGGTPLLFWRAIQAAKAEGAEELDLGRSDWDNPGLITFKSRWGAAQSTLTYYRYPAAVRGESRTSWMARLTPLSSRVPAALQPAMGRLLYRHLG
jgi:CelD/BcsL family acetyltransferase involved in cellulose biosynthesis